MSSVIVAAKTKTSYSLLQSYCLRSDLEILARTSCGSDMLNLAQTYKPDLIVMDTELRGLSGIEAARLLRTRLDYRPDIIFVTNSLKPHIVMDAVNEINAYYILKSEIDRYWNTAIHKVSSANRRLPSVHVIEETANLIHIRYMRKRYPIAEDLILMVEKEPGNKHIKIYLTTGDVIKSSSTIQDISEQVSSWMFESIRGYIVNMRHIAGYTRERSTTDKPLRRYTISFKNSSITAPMGRLQEKVFAIKFYQHKLG
ncbi:LytR/AlgR family response regulator transcription factor [Paenibacillus xylaniclasticus]|uniref:LytR/AlgR family response regulator transcription factor n=1 Tax=Paenibacillus xylaniclasticus TaxID=588083 RepID=UPI0013E03003|nr:MULTISPECIES: response regulator [Paenibacillus]GFN30928.1 hypothetical protein PCURB6_11880 [Paenibacillus curdlanolyticus]